MSVILRPLGEEFRFTLVWALTDPRVAWNKGPSIAVAAARRSIVRRLNLSFLGLLVIMMILAKYLGRFSFQNRTCIRSCAGGAWELAEDLRAGQVDRGGQVPHEDKTVKSPLMTGMLSCGGVKVTYLKLGALAFHNAAMQGGNRRLRAVDDVPVGE